MIDRPEIETAILLGCLVDRLLEAARDKRAVEVTEIVPELVAKAQYLADLPKTEDSRGQVRAALENASRAVQEAERLLTEAQSFDRTSGRGRPAYAHIMRL